MDGETYKAIETTGLGSAMLTDMETIDVDSILKPIIGPWYESLEDPQKAQERTLFDLLKKYVSTEYGSERNASKIVSFEEYRKNFPVVNYGRLLPYFDKVAEGNFRALLFEPPDCWVMTRGSTGKSKVIPATQTHLKQIFTCGARALVHFALRKESFDVFMGDILNLNFPSRVHTINQEGKQVTYGYSSGTYARLNPMFDRVSLLPRQEEIDTLGSGIGRSDWEQRFNS